MTTKGCPCLKAAESSSGKERAVTSAVAGWAWASQGVHATASSEGRQRRREIDQVISSFSNQGMATEKYGENTVFDCRADLLRFI